MGYTDHRNDIHPFSLGSMQRVVYADNIRMRLTPYIHACHKLHCHKFPKKLFPSLLKLPTNRYFIYSQTYGRTFLYWHRKLDSTRRSFFYMGNTEKTFCHREACFFGYMQKGKQISTNLIFISILGNIKETNEWVC